jgi:flagellar protein FliO/FliZ
MGVYDVLKVLLLLIGFCSLLFLTYVTTRYIGGRQNKAMKSKNISVVETVALGLDKRLHLVKAGKKYIMIATTSKHVEFLTTVTLEEPSPEEQVVTQENTGLFDFKSLFEKYMGSYRVKKGKENRYSENETQQDISENHDFKSNLGRLKTIVQKKEFQARENGDDFTNEE